jgi:hypothetical protein
MVRDIDKDTVDFVDNYDGTEKEPVGSAFPFPELDCQRQRRHRRRYGDQHAAAQPKRDDRRFIAIAITPI